MQVVRGGDNCLVTSEDDVHSVLRQYRAQQGSKPPLEGPCAEGACCMLLQSMPRVKAACISHACKHDVDLVQQVLPNSNKFTFYKRVLLKPRGFAAVLSLL